MSLIDSFISYFAPYDCLGCGYEGSLVCESCMKSFKKVTPQCHGRGLPNSSHRTCLTHVRSVQLGAVFAAVVYEGLAKELVWHLKFQGAQAASVTMAKHMLPLIPSGKACLVPVPTATSRVRRRGYDQAKLLAKQLSRYTKLPYLDCLARRGQTHQVGASRKSRSRQLEAAFYVRPARIDFAKQKHLILVDDVITTGATLQAAAAACKSVGARSVSAAAFAQTPDLGFTAGAGIMTSVRKGVRVV